MAQTNGSRPPGGSSRELDGAWLAAEADEELRRHFAEPGADERGWVPLPVPGHWQASDAFAQSQGPLLYRHHFDATPPPPGERAWLSLDGAFYQADVWLDGAYLGPTEGYYVPHAFDVTEPLADRREHLLAVDLACPPVGDRSAKRALTGCFQDSEVIAPGFNPGGLWRPVRLERTGPVRIDRLTALCLEADQERAILELRATLTATEACTVLLRTVVDDAADREGSGEVLVVANELDLAAGTNDVDWRFAVERPRLWWPRALGDQSLYDLRLEAVVGGEVSHRRKRRTGLRQVDLSGWTFRVNGERLHLKGAVLAPTRPALGTAPADEVTRDVDLAVEAGLDLVRLYAHVSRPELYRHADLVGLLVWQDLPIQRGVARGVRRQATRQAREAVALLGHHPGLAIWCGHNEPVPLAEDLDALGDDRDRRRRLRRALVRQELPAVGGTVLDRSIRRAIRSEDRSRPAIPHSGVLPHPPNFDGTDTHLWLGWYRREERDLPRLAARLPRLVRFVSEFGAQAVPDTAPFLDGSDWPDLPWERLAAEHLLQRDLLERHTPAERYPTLDDWREATQRYQARVVQHTVETLRRLKYRPNGGFTVFCLADPQPSIGFGLLDHERRPKRAWAALVEACRPVIAVADRLPPTVTVGQRLRLDVHVVNDRREPIAGARVEAAASAGDWHHAKTWEGDVDADTVTRVGQFDVTVGEEASGRLELRLTVEENGKTVERLDHSTVRRERG